MYKLSKGVTSKDGWILYGETMPYSPFNGITYNTPRCVRITGEWEWAAIEERMKFEEGFDDRELNAIYVIRDYNIVKEVYSIVEAHEVSKISRTVISSIVNEHIEEGVDYEDWEIEDLVDDTAHPQFSWCKGYSFCRKFDYEEWCEANPDYNIQLFDGIGQQRPPKDYVPSRYLIEEEELPVVTARELSLFEEE